MKITSKKQLAQIIIDHFGCTKSSADAFIQKAKEVFKSNKLEDLETLLKEAPEMLKGLDGQGNPVEMPVAPQTKVGPTIDTGDGDEELEDETVQ